jgi:isocitrate lyase
MNLSSKRVLRGVQWSETDYWTVSSQRICRTAVLLVYWSKQPDIAIAGREENTMNTNGKRPPVWADDSRWKGIQRPYTPDHVARLQAIYVSGWQVAGDANLAGQMYPDQSLYPANSVPALVRSINNALMRADQIHRSEEGVGMYWFAPIVADAEAGFGGSLNAFELMKAMIEAGAAAVHFEGFRPPRSAGTWEARCWFPFANSSRN